MSSKKRDPKLRCGVNEINWRWKIETHFQVLFVIFAYSCFCLPWLHTACNMISHLRRNCRVILQILCFLKRNLWKISQIVCKRQGHKKGSKKSQQQIEIYLRTICVSAPDIHRQQFLNWDCPSRYFLCHLLQISSYYY